MGLRFLYAALHLPVRAPASYPRGCAHIGHARAKWPTRTAGGPGYVNAYWNPGLDSGQKKAWLRQAKRHKRRSSDTTRRLEIERENHTGAYGSTQ